MKIDLKPFEVLEQKIQRTVEAVTKLKDENATLRARLSELELSAAESTTRSRQLDSMKLSHDQLEQQLRSLQDERKAVLQRVDGLLQDLSRLGIE
jgi:FtsZ-binding cell division protein ZapB